MVVLLEGVEEELPVAADLGLIAVVLGVLTEGIPLDAPHHRAEELRQRLARLTEVDEDEAFPHVAVN